MIIKFNTNRRNKYEYLDVEEVVNIIRYGNYKCTFFSKEYNFNKTRYREDHLFNLTLKGFIRNLRRLKDERSFNNYDLFLNTHFRVVGIDNSKIKEGINDSFIKRVFKEKNPIDFASDLKNCLPATLWGISSFGNEPHPRWKSKLNTLNNNIKKINQYIVIDIDHLPKQHIEDIKSRLFQEFEFVVMAFVSPSGDGLKIVCEFDDMNGLFSNINEVPYSTLRKMWDSLNIQILDVLNDNIYGIIISRDESADDVNRLCYLSYDPEILFRKDVTPFELESLDINNSAFKNHYELKIIIDAEKEIHVNKNSNYTPDIKKAVTDINNLINGLDLAKIDPFGPHNYEQWMRVGFAICDLFGHNDEYYEQAYELFRRLSLRDSYYGNYMNKGESEIERQFNLKWGKQIENGISYGTMVKWMNDTEERIIDNLVKVEI